jgi:hypothetical protein
MVLVRTGYKVAFSVLCLCLASPAAKAAEPLAPLNLNARYIVAWSGITIGRINIIAREDGSSYFMSVDTKTRGLGALVSDEASEVTIEGTKTAEGTYIPVQYHSGPQGKTQREITHLTYDAVGNITKRSRDPDDDPAWRPPVPFSEIDTARDPITAAFMLRRELYNALQTNTMEVSHRTYAIRMR